MKNLITTAMLLMLLTACSSDDSKKEIEEPVSERIEYEYTTVTPIPDGTVIPLIINLEVPDDRVVIDPTKVHIEINLDHTFAGDISYGYLAPNNGNEFMTIVNELGGINKYIPQNTLSFNPTNTQIINPNTNFSYPNTTVPAGKYKEATNNEEYSVETPLFTSMLNKNIKGTWKFYFLDSYELDEGKVHKIKLIFDEGALQLEKI